MTSKEWTRLIGLATWGARIERYVSGSTADERFVRQIEMRRAREMATIEDRIEAMYPEDERDAGSEAVRTIANYQKKEFERFGISIDTPRAKRSR